MYSSNIQLRSITTIYDILLKHLCLLVLSNDVIWKKRLEIRKFSWYIVTKAQIIEVIEWAEIEANCFWVAENPLVNFLLICRWWFAGILPVRFEGLWMTTQLIQQLVGIPLSNMEQLIIWIVHTISLKYPPYACSHNQMCMQCVNM